MIEIKLEDGQTGYDAVEEYIVKYWEHHSICQVIISMETSFDGQKYYAHKEIAYPISLSAVEYLDDWWEGQQFIKLIGIVGTKELDIQGGIY